jgi:hypothetical protein
MKAKIIGYSIEAVITGVGAMITKYGDTLAWIGFVLIGGGLIAIIATALWGKLLIWIPIRIVNIKHAKISKSQINKQNDISPEALNIANRTIDKLTEELIPDYA